MTAKSYPAHIQPVKSSRESIGQFEVYIPADGEAFAFTNYVEAVIFAHEHQGRLAQVISDPEAPYGFRRIQRELPAAEVVADLKRRTPKKPAPSLWNVPIFGSRIQRTLHDAGAETFAGEMKQRRQNAENRPAPASKPVETTIKPCPFCGTPARFYHAEEQIRLGCANPNCRVWPGITADSTNQMTREELLAVWNARN